MPPPAAAPLQQAMPPCPVIPSFQTGIAVQPFPSIEITQNIEMQIEKHDKICKRDLSTCFDGSSIDHQRRIRPTTMKQPENQAQCTKEWVIQRLHDIPHQSVTSQNQNEIQAMQEMASVVRKSMSTLDINFNLDMLLSLIQSSPARLKYYLVVVAGVLPYLSHCLRATTEAADPAVQHLVPLVLKAVELYAGDGDFQAVAQGELAERLRELAAAEGHPHRAHAARVAGRLDPGFALWWRQHERRRSVV